MAVVIDDRLLLEILSGDAPTDVAAELIEGPVFTTSCWYWRLGRAVTAGSGTGSLSARLAALTRTSRTASGVGTAEALPDAIGLLTFAHRCSGHVGAASQKTAEHAQR